MFELTGDALKRGRAKSFARYCIAKALESYPGEAEKIYENRWPKDSCIEAVRKAAVQIGTSSSSSWSALAPSENLAAEFVEVWRQKSILGQLEGFRRVPENVTFPVQTSGVRAAWTPMAGPAPVRALAFDTATMKASRISGIVVSTVELARLADPSAEAIVERDLGEAINAYMDEALLDPTLAAVADVSPASITYGTTGITGTGTDAAAAVADLKALFAATSTNLTGATLVMRRRTALALAGMGSVFPDVGVHGGTIWGAKVIVSESVPANGNSPSKNRIVLIDADELLVADAGLEVRSSNQASIEMNDTPDSPATASTSLVSLWQSNLVGWFATRFITWRMRRSGAVAYLETDL